METQSTPLATSVESSHKKLSSPGTYIQSSFSYAISRLDLMGWYFLLYIAALLPFVFFGIAVFLGAIFIENIGGLSLPLVLIGGVAFVAALVASVYLLTRNVLAVSHVVFADTADADYWTGWRWSKQFVWSYAWILTIATAVILSGFILLIIPGVILSVYLYLTLPVLVKENRRGMDALVRSFQLVKGYWWGVFGRLLLVGLVMLVLNIALTIVWTLIVVLTPDTIDALFIEGVFPLISSALGIFFVTFGLAVMGRLYTELATSTPATAEISSARTVFQIFAWSGLILLLVGPIAVGVYGSSQLLNSFEAGFDEQYLELDEAAWEIELDALELELDLIE